MQDQQLNMLVNNLKKDFMTDITWKKQQSATVNVSNYAADAYIIYMYTDSFVTKLRTPAIKKTISNYNEGPFSVSTLDKTTLLPITVLRNIIAITYYMFYWKTSQARTLWIKVQDEGL